MSPILGIVASSMKGESGAFESIATAYGTGSSNTITFGSIPQTYKSLQVRCMSRNTVSAGSTVLNITVNANADTSFNYARHNLTGVGESPSVSVEGVADNAYYFVGAYANGAAAGLYGVAILDLIDYASTTKYKTFRTLSGCDDNGVNQERIQLSSGLWKSTSAVTELSFKISSNSFTTDSVFSLYGIKG